MLLKNCYSDLGHFHDVRIDPMGRGLETTAFTTETILFPGLAIRAAVAIDTLRVGAIQSKSAGGHASNGGQDVEFLPGQFAVMIVIAVVFIGAFSEQVMIIAQLELFQAIQLVARDALEVEAVDALTVLVSFHCLWGC